MKLGRVKFNAHDFVVVKIAKGKFPWLIINKLPLQSNQNNKDQKGEQNNMNMQYEIAKMVTNNQIPDEEIDKGLALLSQEEWDKQCAMLDKMMKEHVENRKDKPVEEVMLQDSINVGAANNVSATTVWVAYLKWLDVEYVVPYKM